MRLAPYGVAISLALILLLAAALRLYHIGTLPTELDPDELDLYNSAYSIATTGHDVDGTTQPFLYSALTRNPPMYAVAAYGSSLIFGRTPLGLRAPAVLFGLLAIVLLYGIAFELTRRRDVALVSALLMATQPLFVHFARIGWEPASELPFLLGGLYILLRAMRPPAISVPLIITASFVLGLTAYTYMGGWFYALLLGGAIIALDIRRFTSPSGARALAGAVTVWLVTAMPALQMWFLDEHTVSHTLRIVTFAGGVSPNALRTFFVNYAAHFSWQYLVTTGDPQPAITWRYLNGMGAFFGWVIPLAAIGLIASARYIRPRWALVWTWLWLTAYPLGGALTNEGAPGTPNAPRTLAGAPVFCMLAAIGFALLFDWVTARRPRAARVGGLAIRAALLAAVAFSTAYFARFYFTQYVHQNSNAWLSGTRALFTAIRDDADGYRRVCFNVRSAWYELPSYVRFYLNGVPLHVIDNVGDRRCLLPGTLTAVDSDHPLRRANFFVLARINDVDGSPFAILSGRP